MLLRLTKHRISKHEFMSLNDRDLVNVYFRPGTNDDDPAKPYWPVGYFDPEDPPVRSLSYDELCIEHWVTHGGLSLEEADEKLRKSGYWQSQLSNPGTEEVT